VIIAPELARAAGALLLAACALSMCLPLPATAQVFESASSERVANQGAMCGALAYKSDSAKPAGAVDRCLDSFFSALEALPAGDRFNAASIAWSAFPCFGAGARKERVVHKALEAAQQLGDFELVIGTLYNQGVCYWNDRPPQFQKALQSFEPFKNALAPFVNPSITDTPEKVAGQAAIFRDAGRKYVRFLDNARRVAPKVCSGATDRCLEDAWTLTQRLKARMFHSRIIQAMVERDSTGRLSELLRAEYRLAQHRESLRLGLRAGAGAAMSPDGIGKESAAIEQELRARFPDYARFYQGLAPPIADLQAALREDEIYISYLITDRFTLAFRVSRREAPVFLRLNGTSAELMELVTAINNGISLGATGRPFNDDLERAASQLLGPLKIPSGAKIIIEADETLSSFPFALGAGNLNDSIISYVPSAGAFLQSRSAQATRGPGGLYLGFGRTSFPTPLPQLPGVRQELRDSASVFGSRAVFSSADAAESDVYRLSKQLAQAQVAHFASHTVFDGGEIALMLRPGSGEDGRLTEREILGRLRLSADLVILSACDTATLNRQGDIPGEAFSALTRAFFAAGAKKLLVTQWRVDDKAATHFVSAFLADYAQSGDAARALRSAQRALRADSRFTAKDWAAWIVVGD
jgi:hypothetical protein